MSRAARLLDLVQALRRRRGPVAGAVLAGELGVSLRTLYRDVATLQAQGAAIEGEAGVGYVLRSGFLLPPLMFADEELEALVLGSRWVAANGDPTLARAARDALAKIAAVLPGERRETFDEPGLLVADRQLLATAPVGLDLLRRALREERKLTLLYRDAEGRETRRLVWPIALGFFETTRVLAAWCESRAAFRHFRVDRMVAAEIEETRPPRRRRALLAEWRRAEGIPPRP
ncbi:helix-turn-helix transcriptional regulator [Pinisolibacter aquiterrae]|uniref:helix-turn-helix transcriptional regulator n=1 Tax=Pinisolibacter aquiterrae TaxID=2815579 RepID=UPI001C3C3266|nr:YafY family protein [Pinisolibacter aquiterrae]MBV5263537.1 YafY family transcriptional regulator [Pinisolibacter aquiterrae]MCC8237409.1 YafY family transcriptional regulator [Pinisolibacter aquiterrae]